MFQFSGFATVSSCLQHDRFPHSDIHGSRVVCTSPWLFAAYHVLRRLREPRHPPYALTSLPSLYPRLLTKSGSFFSSNISFPWLLSFFLFAQLLSLFSFLPQFYCFFPVLSMNFRATRERFTVSDKLLHRCSPLRRLFSQSGNINWSRTNPVSVETGPPNGLMSVMTWFCLGFNQPATCRPRRLKWRISDSNR